MEQAYGDFIISDDKSLLKIETICDFLSRSYWANQRPVETTIKSIHNSICYGIYLGDKQVGYARIVTDWATIYYLCDVFIDEDYRGKGLGKKLVEIITEQYEGMMGLLGTLDAHELYEQYGFIRNTERFMNRRPR
ncbi:GNAT family N-acetyltransferase [Paenibacillus eucommiae]|uniref:GNAT superfamily N-acetyltransferase n=1 Tax=Paenibacillus eucommiae TaxID=1355755 RepID=A0ABS4J3X8_9BACL|nr:GNAT superfamily N-acetyltransferase [Paenibacillus eucommiae]